MTWMTVPRLLGAAALALALAAGPAAADGGTYGPPTHRSPSPAASPPPAGTTVVPTLPKTALSAPVGALVGGAIGLLGAGAVFTLLGRRRGRPGGHRQR